MTLTLLKERTDGQDSLDTWTDRVFLHEDLSFLGINAGVNILQKEQAFVWGIFGVLEGRIPGF